MGQTAGRTLAGVFRLLVVGAGVISAQDKPIPHVLPNSNPSQKEVLPCERGTDYEKDKYHIANTEVDDPFKFLYWIGGKRDRIEAQLAAKFKENDNLFTYQLVDKDALKLI